MRVLPSALNAHGAACVPSALVDRPDVNDPDIQAMHQEFLDQRNTGWLDESIPMFGGLTRA